MAGLNNPLNWDDSLLLKAYESNLDLAQEEIARRIANSTNSRSSANKGDEDAVVETPEEPPTLKIGDFARATYTDGIDYEGCIISIDEDANNCVIRYVGYENEQEIPLNELLPSWGKKARRSQFIEAMNVEHEESAATTAQHAKKSSAGAAASTTTKKPVKSKMSVAMPPPPPVPPIFRPTGDFDGDGGQDLAAMLMSWYMSGYYTGFYQGKMQGSKKTKVAKK